MEKKILSASGKELFSCEAETTKEALEKAVAAGANLRGANLRDANLRGANLCGANLCDANLFGEKITKQPLFLYGLFWPVTITEKHMAIGCQKHMHESWKNFSEDEIEEMADEAAGFWSVWREPLLAMCETHAKEG